MRAPDRGGSVPSVAPRVTRSCRVLPRLCSASLAILRHVTEQLLTVHEVATQLKVQPETVRRWIRAGKLHGRRLGGDKMGYRITEGELERLLRDLRRANAGG